MEKRWSQPQETNFVGNGHSVTRKTMDILIAGLRIRCNVIHSAFISPLALAMAYCED